jgi:hypothetical protein
MGGLFCIEGVINARLRLRMFIAGSKHCVIETLRQFFGVTCEMAIIIANIIGFAILIVLVLVVIVFIKYR